DGGSPPPRRAIATAAAGRPDRVLRGRLQRLRPGLRGSRTPHPGWGARKGPESRHGRDRGQGLAAPARHDDGGFRRLPPVLRLPGNGPGTGRRQAAWLVLRRSRERTATLRRWPLSMRSPTRQGPITSSRLTRSWLLARTRSGSTSPTTAEAWRAPVA